MGVLSLSNLLMKYRLIKKRLNKNCLLQLWIKRFNESNINVVYGIATFKDLDLELASATLGCNLQFLEYEKQQIEKFFRGLKRSKYIKYWNYKTKDDYLY